MEKTNLDELNNREFMTHVVHYLRQYSSSIEAAAKMVSLHETKSFNEEHHAFIKLIFSNVVKIKHLENEISERLKENRNSHRL